MLERMSTGTWAALVMSIGLIGCVDARSKFDEYDDRVGSVDASTTDAPPSMVYDINGRFLLAVDPAFIPGSDPTTFVQFIATWTLTEQNGSTTVDGRLQPLRVVQSNPDRMPVGAPLVSNGMAVDANGSFSGSFSGMLPGEANPVSGSMQPIASTLDAQIRSVDLVCGTVRGTVAGIDLAGSTFAAIRLTDETPANLPAPVGACP